MMKTSPNKACEGYVDAIRDEEKAEAAEEAADAEASKLVPLSACISAFGEAESLQARAS